MKTFFKSISGTYYYDVFPIDYPVGYTVVSKDEYNAWCIANRFFDLVVK